MRKGLLAFLLVFGGCSYYAKQSDLMKIANVVNVHHQALTDHKETFEILHPDVKARVEAARAKKKAEKE